MKHKKVWISGAAFLFVVIAFAVWGVLVEPRRLVMRDVTLAIPNWTQANDGLRLAVLTDLHVGSPHHGLGKLRTIVERVNRQNVDVVLILGDLMIQGVAGGNPVAPESIARELQQLRAHAGVFAVLGNHDWWFNAPRVRASLERVGIKVLEDSAIAVRGGGRGFWLIGIGDFWEGRHDVAAAMRHVTDPSAAVAFTHNPDVFPAVPARVSLTLAGHTHGGQVKLPLLGRPIVPSRFGERYAYGHIVEGGRHLYVSSGTGTSILPVRFRVPPEIVIVTLRSSS